MIPTVWTAALLMVKRYGADAVLEAAARILDAIERLQAKAPAEGEPVH